MSTILAYLENSGESLPKSAQIVAAGAIDAKAKHGYSKSVAVLIGAAGVEKAAAEAANYGFDEVVFVKDDALANYLAVPYSKAVLKVAEEVSASLVISCATTKGKDLMPRVTEVLGAAQASDIIEFVDGGQFKRPVIAGNMIATITLQTDKKTATLRSTAFDAAEKQSSACAVREVSGVDLDAGGQEFVNFESVKSERPELTDADVVVSGGRALKSAENFEGIIAPLADALGAAIGASRAAVDSGFAPNDWQVGQTGKVVAPKLYIAVGISGAIQHLAGMKDSKVIVAINTDPDAPIFEVADYGLVADLYDVLPELTKAVS